jgi:hypothetical protein
VGDRDLLIGGSTQTPALGLEHRLGLPLTHQLFEDHWIFHDSTLSAKAVSSRPGSTVE